MNYLQAFLKEFILPMYIVIIKLMQENRAAYDALMSPGGDLRVAYEEGRVLVGE